MHQEVLNKVAAVPGVTSAAFTTRLPMDPRNRWSAALSVDGQPHDGSKSPPNRQVKLISPGAFQTFGTPLVAGRDFTWTDLDELRNVAIVSENLAREYWGSAQAAVGQRIRQFYGAPGPWREVVGVATDVYDDGVYKQAPATVYWPARLDPKVFGPYQPRRVSFVIRTDRAGTRQPAGGVASSGVLVESDAGACAGDHAGCVVRPVDVVVHGLRSCCSR